MPPLQSPSTRQQCDVTKLIVAGYELELIDDNGQDFYVTFHGPKGTAYESGVWRVHVTLPGDYPFASPSIGFVNKILHPNIDEASGTVCLDVINQTWTPLYSLVNVFDIFLPQLLTYPNAADPLNADAGSLLLQDKDEYESKIRDYVRKHASYDAYLRSRAARRDKSVTTLTTAAGGSEDPSLSGTIDSSESPTSSSVVSHSAQRLDESSTGRYHPTTSNKGGYLGVSIDHKGLGTAAASSSSSSGHVHLAEGSSPALSSPSFQQGGSSLFETSNGLSMHLEPSTPLSDISMTDVMVPDDDNLMDDGDDILSL